MKDFFRKLYKKYCDSDSFLKITFLFESVLIISLVFVSVFATKTFSSILKEKELVLGENKMQALSDFMQEEYNRIYSLGNYIHSGGISEIITEISETEASAYEYSNISAMRAFFSGIGYSDENISDVILVSDRGNVYSYTRQDALSVTPSYDFWEEKTVQKLLSSERNFITFYDNPSRYCVQEREAVISFAGKIYDASLFPSKKVRGIYIMNIPVAQIEKDLSFSDALQGEIFLTNEEDQILYSNNEQMWGKILKEDKLQKGDGNYNNRQTLGSSGMNVTYQLSEKLLFSQIYKIRNRIMAVMVLAIAITFLFSYVIYKIFQRKINILLASMVELEKGNFDIKLPVQAKDEIGRISMQFNEMCQKLNTYVQQVYRSEIQRKNAEINALQTQIDPHFLYNTLESIKAQALAGGDTDAADMVAILGNLFRWSSRTGDKLATLDEELEYIRNYLILQSYRYNHQLEISINVKEEYLDYAVPKLILQPIVENVVKYALDSTSGKKLVGIYARKKEENLELTVYDNGQGILPERLNKICEKLYQDEEQDEFDSIGMQNVNQRLRLMFGPEYRLQIKSIENYGTAVKITVPAMSKKEMSQIV